MVILYAGRRPGKDFPPECVPRVRNEVERLIRRLLPRVAVGSAAAGADLLVAESAQRAGAELVLYLAGDRRLFRQTSVADKGEEWAAAFDELLGQEHVRVREIGRHAEADESYRAVTRAVVAAAEDCSLPGEEIALLAILSPHDESGHTAEMLAGAAARGWLVHRVDPRP